MDRAETRLVIWDVDGTLIPADLRWLRRAIARTYNLSQDSVVFPDKKVHGYTDESIVRDTAVASGVSMTDAEQGLEQFGVVIADVMDEGRDELAREQPPFPGAAECIAELHRQGYVQTVLTGNLRYPAEVKLGTLGLDRYLDLRIGGFGSDDRDRFNLPAVVARRYQQAYGRALVPNQTVVIGDAPNDVACARHAGFHVIVIAHRAASPDLEASHPDAILDRLDPGGLSSSIGSLLIV